VAREAAKQCGRAVVPEVEIPRPLDEWLPALGTVDVALCLWEGDAPALASVLTQAPARPRTAAAIVGPEGGLARQEVERARAHGYRTVSLGPRILRTETAGIAVLSILQFYWGELG
jgi:16S rRNA (uracil1498-N3)-methyltransferase